MEPYRVINLILGTIGTLTGVFSLVWHMVRSRRDRCDFKLSESRVTYFAVPPGWKYNFIGGSGLSPAPIGTWVRFSGRLRNKGYQPGSVERIRVTIPSLADDGEGTFLEGDLRMPIYIEAHRSTDISFRCHLTTDYKAAERLPEEVWCIITLEDQSDRRHRSRFSAIREEPARFSVQRRSP